MTKGSSPQEYEELVADVLAQIAIEDGIRVSRNQLLRGKSGQDHQIDILVDFEKLGVLYRTLVECKCWNQRVGVEPVMVLAERMKDVGAQKGILVTTLGFQDGAYRLAAANGVALVICKGRQEYIVEYRRETASGGGASMSAMINSIFEKRFSYYLCSSPTVRDHTAFPLLLEV